MTEYPPSVHQKKLFQEQDSGVRCGSRKLHQDYHVKRLRGVHDLALLLTAWPHPPSSSLPPSPYWVLWQVENLFSGEKLIIWVALMPQPFPSPDMSFLGKYHFLLVHCFQKSDSQRVCIIASRLSLFLPGRPDFLTPRNSFWLIHYRC